MSLDAELQRLVAAHDAAVDPAAPAAAERRRAVLALHQAGRIEGSAARIAAARVLLTGDRAEVEVAQRLLLATMAHEPAARRLVAEAYDRLRVLAGRPQKFGTQTVVRDGRRELLPVGPLTPDSAGGKWDVGPRAELHRRAATMAP